MRALMGQDKPKKTESVTILIIEILLWYKLGIHKSLLTMETF